MHVYIHFKLHLLFRGLSNSFLILIFLVLIHIHMFALALQCDNEMKIVMENVNRNPGNAFGTWPVFEP